MFGPAQPVNCYRPHLSDVCSPISAKVLLQQPSTTVVMLLLLLLLLPVRSLGQGLPQCWWWWVWWWSQQLWRRWWWWHEGQLLQVQPAGPLGIQLPKQLMLVGIIFEASSAGVHDQLCGWCSGKWRVQHAITPCWDACHACHLFEHAAAFW